MAAVLRGLVTGIRASGTVVNYGGAFISGAIDGILLRKVRGAVGGALFLAKNIGVPIAAAFGAPIPEGVKHHCVGQLGMAVVLMAT